MKIIGTKIVGLEKSPFSNWELTRYKINPAIDNQFTSLPGDHSNYSYVLSKNFEKWIKIIEHFKIRADDIWIIGYPKTGTTWTHNIVYKLKNGIECNDIADKLEELFFDKKDKMKNGGDLLGIDRFDNIPSPRIFKTHLPAFLLPKQIWTVKPKIIYTVRNPKDTVLSQYHMIRNSYFGYSGTFDEFSDIFMNEAIIGSPFFDHLLGFLQLKHLDHILFSVYEERLAQPFEEIKRISDFLQCELNDCQLKQLVEEVSFKKMQKEFPSFWSPKDGNDNVPDPSYKFCRKGKAGGYQDEMTKEMIKKFDDWTKKQLKDVDFEFYA